MVCTGGWRNLEPSVVVQPYLVSFLHLPEAHIPRIMNMMRVSINNFGPLQPLPR